MTNKCQNSNFTFSVNAIPEATYQWTIPGNYTLVSGSLTDASVIVNWSDNDEVGSKNVEVSIMLNGCTFDNAQIIQVESCPCNGFENNEAGNCATGEICCSGNCTVPPDTTITVL